MNRSLLSVATAFLALLLMSAPLHAAPEFEFKLTPETSSMISGAPLKLEVVLSNNGQAPVSIHFMDDGREAFSFTIRDPQGREVASADFFKPRAGGRAPLVIAPGTGQTRSIFLNRWISTRLPAGEYEVRGRARYFTADPKTPLEALAAFKLTIVETMTGQAEAQLDILREIAQSEPAVNPAAPPNPPSGDPAADGRREARTRIAMADFPEAPAYRSLIFCACTECGRVDFDDAAARIKSRPDPADIQMLMDVVRQTGCAGPGRAAAKAVLAEIYIATSDQALKRAIRPVLDIAVPK